MSNEIIMEFSTRNWGSIAVLEVFSGLLRSFESDECRDETCPTHLATTSSLNVGY